MSLNNKKVAVNFSGVTRYFHKPPFHPPERYPEYEGPEVQEDNNIYPAIRQVLYQAGLDQERFGTPEWNPFGEFIEPGILFFSSLTRCATIILPVVTSTRSSTTPRC